jgi:hypothetical protein
VTPEIVALFIFAVLFLALRHIVNRGMDAAEQKSPTAGAGCTTFWLLVGLVGLPIIALIAAQLSGHTDVIGILLRR